MYRKFGMFLALFALVLFIAGGGATLSSSTVRAAAFATDPAPTCSQTGCDTLDPHATNCDVHASDAKITWIDPGVTLSFIAERWGPNCRTNWARADIQNSFFYRYDLTITRQGGNGLRARSWGDGGLDCSNYCWGNQLYTNNNLAQACIYSTTLSPNTICSPWG